MTPNSVTQDADDATVVERVSARRAARFEARHVLWQESRLRRVRSCGRSVRSADGVAVKVTEGPQGRSAGFSGLATCGSVWACPVCSAKVAAHRQGEISDALTEWHKRGGRVAMVTLTMRHRKGQSLASLWKGLSYAWGKVTTGRSWVSEQVQHGTAMPRTIRSGLLAGTVVRTSRIPIIRVVEVTHGENGWHVHVHALLLLAAGATDSAVAYLGDQMFTRWRDALLRKDFEPPTYRHGVDATLFHGDPSAALGEYFTKAVYRASHEAARGDLKDARDGNRKPFEILADVVRLGDADDLQLWHEWERVSAGKRQIAWSPGLREYLFGDREELTDEQIAEQDNGGDVVAEIPAPVWREIARARADIVLLRAFELSDLDGHAYLEIFRQRARAVRLERDRLEGQLLDLRRSRV